MSKYPISYNDKVLFTLQCTFTSIVLFNPHSDLARKVLFFFFVGEETFPVQTALLHSRPCFRHLGWPTSIPSIMHPERNSVSSHSPLIQTRTCSSSRIAHLSSWHHHLPTQVGRNLQDSSLSFSPSPPPCHLSVKFPPSSISLSPSSPNHSSCVSSDPDHLSWANALAWMLFRTPVLSISLLPHPSSSSPAF